MHKVSFIQTDIERHSNQSFYQSKKGVYKLEIDDTLLLLLYLVSASSQNLASRAGQNLFIESEGALEI